VAAGGAGAAAGRESPEDWISVTWPLGTARSNFNMLNAFLQGLHELGYTDGQNLTVERLYADGGWDRLRELAADFLAHSGGVRVFRATRFGVGGSLRRRVFSSCGKTSKNVIAITADNTAEAV
jgi:hypothetical protein